MKYVFLSHVGMEVQFSPSKCEPSDGSTFRRTSIINIPPLVEKSIKLVARITLLVWRIKNLIYANGDLPVALNISLPSFFYSSLKLSYIWGHNNIMHIASLSKVFTHFVRDIKSFELNHSPLLFFTIDDIIKRTQKLHN